MSNRGIRAFINSTIRARSILGNVPTPMRIQNQSHHDGPPQPFDNMPFKIRSRFPKDPYVKAKWIEATGRQNWFPEKTCTVCSEHFEEKVTITIRLHRAEIFYILKYFATVVFAFFFGTGLWAPYIIVWYSMAKRTL